MLSKSNNSRKGNRGIALIGTLILSLVALSAIGALTSYIIFAEKTSARTKKYTSSLEAAKGAADYIIKGLVKDTINCKNAAGNVQCKCSSLTDGTLYCPTSSGTQANIIDMGSYSTLGDYTITATLLSKASSGGATIYAVRVESKKGSEGEKSTIEFVLKVD